MGVRGQCFAKVKKRNEYNYCKNYFHIKFVVPNVYDCCVKNITLRDIILTSRQKHLVNILYQ
jgi:hypothetical protein